MKKSSVQQNSPQPKFLPVGLFTLLSLISVQLLAAEQGLCKTQTNSISSKNAFSNDGKTHLQSDKVEFNEKDTSRFDGNVVIQQTDKRIETDHAEYTKQTEEVTANGSVRFLSSNLKVESESAHFNLKSDQAILNKASYKGINSRAHGKAAKIEIKNKDITILTDATYTTCDPSKTDWLLNASTLKFDNKEHQGYASNVVIRFKGVPFFLLSLFAFSSW